MTILFQIWLVTAIINMLVISVRQKQEPVSKNAYKSALIRSVIMGPVWTVGLLASVAGLMHKH
jgi:hypothetical protein